MSTREHLKRLYRSRRWQCWTVLFGILAGLATMVATTERASAQGCYWISNWVYDPNWDMWYDYGYWWCPTYGCTDPNASNYNPNADADDGSCQYPPPPPPPVYGCTDPNASNYNSGATVNDGSCQYPPPPVYGCTDPNATNYNSSATVNDGSCQYPPVMNYSFSTYASGSVSDDGSTMFSLFDSQDYSTGYPHTYSSQAYVRSPTRSAYGSGSGLSASASLAVAGEEGSWEVGGTVTVVCAAGGVHTINIGASIPVPISTILANYKLVNTEGGGSFGTYNRCELSDCYQAHLRCSLMDVGSCTSFARIHVVKVTIGSVSACFAVSGQVQASCASP